MNNGLRLIFTLAVVVTLTGCSTPYMIDRRRDAADIFTIGVGVGLGAKARVGPIQTGLLGDIDLVALRGGAVGVFIPVPDDLQLLVTGQELFWPVAPLGLPDPEPDGNVFEKRGKMFYTKFDFKHPFWHHVVKDENAAYYCHHVAEDERALYYYTQIELVGALVGSVRVGFNPGELVDFILGWTTIDIFNDDIETRKTKAAK